MRVRRVASIAVASIALAGFFTTPARAAGETPTNDDRVNAELVSAVPTHAQVDTTGATNEADEPTECGAMSRSVWWKVTLPAPTELRISTASSDFDTIVTVYKDTAGGDELVTCNDDAAEDLTSRVGFETEAGATYFVQVGGFGGSYGSLQVHFTAFEPLGNDAFAAAYPIGGSEFAVEASTDGSTKEADEPMPCDRLLIERTVWFSWTAPADGTLEYYASERVIGVYRGTSLSSLEPVGCGQTYGEAEVVGGETYLVQVGVNDLGAAGLFTLYGAFDVTPVTPPTPANDDLADAETISGLDEFHVANNSGATTEPGEPICVDSSRTLWYRYTATETGPMVATSEGSDTDTTVAVYTGTSYDDLAQVACNDQSVLSSTSRTGFIAEAGLTYLIQVGEYGDGGWWGGNGDIRIGVLRGAAVGDAPAAGTLTTDEEGIHEAGLEVNGFLAGGGASVGPGGSTAVCAYAVVFGTCVGSG